MSVLELVRAGSLDLRVASLLWLLMELRAPVLVAAGPSFAGKTTTFNALLDFLHPDVRLEHLNGWGEDFAFLKEAEPSKTYIVAEEFSDYGDYVWGETAQKAFSLLEEGFSLGGTIHARTAKEVLLLLHKYLGISIPLLGRLGMLVTLSATRQGNRSEILRRLQDLTLVTSVKEGLAIQSVATLETGNGACVVADDEVLQASISKKFGLRDFNVSETLKTRESYLSGLMKEGTVARDQVREAIVNFYRSRHAHSAFI